MSDKIFACLLRLFPSRFRTEYEAEALRLYRERLRDETGFVRRVRLWFDLFVDLIFGLPQAYRNSYAAAAPFSLPANVDGIPSFRMLQKEPLRRGSILMGGALTLGALAAFGFLISHTGARFFNVNSKEAMSPIDAVIQRLNQAPAPGRTQQDAAAASTQENASQAQPADSNAAAVSIRSRQSALDAGERDRVIQAVAQNLNQYYVDRQLAQKASDALLAHERHGDYDAFTDGDRFAHRLTADVRTTIEDRHLAVIFSTNPIPRVPAEPTAATLEQYRAAMKQDNCTFERVEVLPHNLGYLKLNSFPDPQVCGATAESVMKRLNRADAIIFDLRDNLGGYPDMVERMADPLFDHPVPWYNPRDAAGGELFTHSPVAGSSLAHKPVYILTSSRTFSAAEHFTYNLKMLERAVVVGETTGGAAHAGAFHRIDDHFGMGIPETRITNPYGKPDWEGTGVEPDVKANAASALEVAQKLALQKIDKN